MIDWEATSQMHMCVLICNMNNKRGGGALGNKCAAFDGGVQEHHREGVYMQCSGGGNKSIHLAIYI